MLKQTVVARGPVLHELAQEIVRIQKLGDAPIAIWLCAELFADALEECKRPEWTDFEIPVFSPVTHRIELVPVRPLGQVHPR